MKSVFFTWWNLNDVIKSAHRQSRPGCKHSPRASCTCEKQVVGVNWLGIKVCWFVWTSPVTSSAMSAATIWARKHCRLISTQRSVKHLPTRESISSLFIILVMTRSQRRLTLHAANKTELCSRCSRLIKKKIARAASVCWASRRFEKEESLTFHTKNDSSLQVWFQNSLLIFKTCFPKKTNNFRFYNLAYLQENLPEWKIAGVSFKWNAVQYEYVFTYSPIAFNLHIRIF